jgi:peptidoglycan/LPS O-acetylase OafA/YrhL
MRHHMPALDGLRGVAILLVLAYHLGWLPGGSHGVTLFFVLSGFLITGIILREVDEKGRLDWRRFYIRRAARLIPALVVVVAAFVAVGGPPANAWPALTYTSNFLSAGGRNLGALQHTWSVAVEEHFYLVWPIVLVAIPARLRFRLTAWAVLSAAAWRVWLIETATWERAYYATDAAAVALLAGCLLAVARHEDRVVSTRWAMAATVTIGMAAVLGEGTAFLWVGFVVSGLSVVAVNGCVGGARALEGAPVRWLGRLSYGIYLWHPFVFVFAKNPVGLAVALGIAWLSWRAVERPAMRWASQIRNTKRSTLVNAPVPRITLPSSVTMSSPRRLTQRRSRWPHGGRWRRRTPDGRRGGGLVLVLHPARWLSGRQVLLASPPYTPGRSCPPSRPPE